MLRSLTQINRICLPREGKEDKQTGENLYTSHHFRGLMKWQRRVKNCEMHLICNRNSKRNFVETQ